MHTAGVKNLTIHRFLIATSVLLAADLALAGEAGRISLSVGDVRVAGQRVAQGGAVNEGDELTTGSDGYTYIKTIDSGLLILRPNTHVRIVAYHVDSQQPANTRIKFELLKGVARSVSGRAVKQSRQNFRFNTPVAAIGVRGTDFTVFTDQQTTRVAVISGGIVASGFTGACGPEGSGPCEGPASRELFAGQSDALLQVIRGQAVPQLLRGNRLSPDTAAPPRQDEPVGKNANAATGNTAPNVSDISLDAQKGTLQFYATSAAPVIPPRQIVWGRWQPILDQPGNVDITKIVDAKGELLVISPYFALLRTSGTDWQKPSQGTMGFALARSEAYILNESSGALAPAGLQNAQLQVDFAKSSFATGFDLVSQQNERFKFQAQGVVSSDGRLIGNSQFSSPTNMAVRGALGSANGGEAAYLFQGRIDDQRLATGAAAWAKN